MGQTLHPITVEQRGGGLDPFPPPQVWQRSGGWKEARTRLGSPSPGPSGTDFQTGKAGVSCDVPPTSPTCVHSVDQLQTRARPLWPGSEGRGVPTWETESARTLSLRAFLPLLRSTLCESEVCLLSRFASSQAPTPDQSSLTAALPKWVQGAVFMQRSG